MDQLFFLASKVLGLLVRPDTWLVLLLAVAVFWRIRWAVTVVLVSVLGLAILPLGSWALSLHEKGTPPSVVPDDIRGIIILGGAEETERSLYFNQIHLNEAGERMFVGAQLARDTGLPIVVTGGYVSVTGNGPKGADVMADALQSLGVPAAQILKEDAARTTWENARLSYDLVQPAMDDTWLLVTSAFHMRRSLAAFRAAGWQVAPYPVDYRARPLDWMVGWDFTRQLDHLILAIRECVGLYAYRWTRRG